YDYSGTLSLFAGNADGTFQAPVPVDTSLTKGGPVAAADFDLDGRLDLVKMEYDDEVVLPGNGDGTFGQPVSVMYAYPGSVAAGDVNGDGLPDLVTGHDLSPGILNVSLNTTPVGLRFAVSAPKSATAGDSFEVTVTARDATGAVLTGYTGTVHFTSYDPQAE